MKKKIIIFILISALIVGYFTLRPKKPSDEIVVYGNVEIREVNMSFEVPGWLEQLLVEEGDRVKKGQLMAILRDIDYKANYEKSIADEAANKARAADALSLYNRNVPLCKDNTTSEQKCVNLSNTKDETKAVYEASVAARQYAKNQLYYTRIYAPCDGTVMIRNREPGSVVAAGETVCTLAKDKPVWIRVFVPETYLGNVKYGMKAKVLTDSIDPSTGELHEYTGWVGYISPVAEFTPKTVQTETLRTDLVYRIRIYIYDTDEYLRQGMPTTVKIKTNEQETLKSVPE